MTRVRVLFTLTIFSTLLCAWPAQNAVAQDASSTVFEDQVVFEEQIVFEDQLRAVQPTAGSGHVLGGQLSLVEGECAPRPQALVQSRSSDGTVLWERAAKASPERGALPLFAGFGEIDPSLVTTSTVHAVARAPYGGDIFVAGDVLSSWMSDDGEPRTAWGGFIVRLTPLGEPIAERYFGARPAGRPLMTAGIESTCSAPVCEVRLASELETVSLRELAVTQSGEVMARGYRRTNGERQPFLAVLSGGLEQILWSGTGESTLAPVKLASAEPEPIAPIQDPFLRPPDAFAVTLGTLNVGGLAELSASDDQYLRFFAEIQSEEQSLGEVVAEFNLDPEMPVLEQVTAEVYVELCTTVSISLGGGYIGNETVELSRQAVCPFDEPTFNLAVPDELADSMGFGRRDHGAAGQLPAFVTVAFDMQREPPPECGGGGSCASQGDEGTIDVIILTTDYP